VRYHLGLAALILIGGIVGGWWFSRGSSGPKTPVEIRNSIATGDAVVVNFRGTADSAGVSTTITFVKDKGWTWQQPGGAGSHGTIVIAAPSHTLMAAAPGCYITIPDTDAPSAPSVPGVNLVRDLGHAPALKQAGDTYSYTVPADAGTGTPPLSISENLAGIAATHTYKATVTIEGSPGGTSGRIQPGVYTIQAASSAERQAAERMLSDTVASPVAAFTVKQRLLQGGAPTQAGGIAMVSPEDCPDALAINPDVLGTNASPLFFSMANPAVTLGVAVTTKGPNVLLKDVLVVDQPFDANTDVLLAALAKAGKQTVPIREGLTFSLPPTGGAGSAPALMSVSGCQATAWFPC